MDSIVSGVGVIDKSFAIIDLVAGSPRALSEIAAATGITRATTHRLLMALELHGMVRRVGDGRFALGYRVLALAQQIDGLGPLADAARPHLLRLTRDVGESAQLYVRDGDERVCVATAESGHGLRTIVPVGSRLTLERGSAAAVLSGRSEPGEIAVSVAEREPGVASVSAAVLDAAGGVVAALSVSGPVDRMGVDPGSRFGPVVLREAIALGADYASMATTSTLSVAPVGA